MDSLIAAAGRALATGDPLGALQRVALREDPAALALRGIAMAQLGEHPRARELLRRAVRGFGHHEIIARARCVVADAEVALAMRDLRGATQPLRAAADSLQLHGDTGNALHAHLLMARRALLIGRLQAAGDSLQQLHGQALPPALAAMANMVAAELALRALRVDEAEDALARARLSAQRAGIAALSAEVESAGASLRQPAARCFAHGREQPLCLREVQQVLAADTLVIDGCRRGLHAGSAWQSLARRPLLFALAKTLALAWPASASRESLIAAAFPTPYPDESHRARLRVEIGRLRRLAKPMFTVVASEHGFLLRPRSAGVVVLEPPIDGEQAALLALLADGMAWSTSALSLALGDSQRTVQRALVELQARQRVRSIGQGRTQRWLAPPLLGFTTVLLLPSTLPAG
ncbi:hypothetical protein [Pseudoxanthomonas dokdonensis]|uniref:DNA-binding protein n=1 Tax=Pseudoxanthomonas dokdonensis TaxID=344882 RepID=A0A0R0CRA4_9GAMM|nr:hypothetical protein [Pseudoxanthomonas dokdonensis]KRG68414.1 DNA-binding protein [Pseudoxanthomonas dokdonensis]